MNRDAGPYAACRVLDVFVLSTINELAGMFNRWCLMMMMAVQVSCSVQAQSYQDSLLSVWNDTSRPDTSRLAAAHKLVWRVYLQRAPDTARFYAEQQLALAREKGLLKQMSAAYNSIGVTHHIQGDLEQAIGYYQLSMATDMALAAEMPGDVAAVVGITSSLANLGILHQQLGDIPDAMEHYQRALHLLDSLEGTGADVNRKIADVQNSIGLAHETQKSSTDALLWFRRAQERYAREEPGSAQANTLSNIGNALQRLAMDTDDAARRDSLSTAARKHHELSLLVREELGDRRGMANALNNIAAALQYRAKRTADADLRRALLAEAEERFRESAALAEEVQDRAALAGTWGNLAENLLLQDRPAEAVRFGERALELARSIGHAEFIQRAAGHLHTAYKRLGRIAPALEMHELYTAMQDSLRNEENTRTMLRQQYAYDYAKREALLVAEQEKENALAQAELKRRAMQRNGSLLGLGMLAVVAVVILRQRNRIVREKARSEELLLNILPEEVAEELKEKGEAEAVLIDQVTVLFTDFKGFTAMSEQVTPKQLVKDLHECFSAFDHICGKHGLEKIKTIGDAYMAAGGLPTPNTTHATDVIKAALEMRDFIAEGKARKIAAGLPFFEIRIGIHTGPVVAGIVGVKKFSYDIWGDTVNTASRMESSGEVGKVNISEATYAQVMDDPGLSFTPRGKVQAKGKGELEMYFVHRSTDRA
jgi:adenylate cyclase